ncbi:UNVERIFIED_CONTAM: hypothetical protein PYX00_010630 [Menopon gallinae]|uniref:Enkurin domain-containing protein n=1 Tax=Menopon gallinae TaxID=328185 RepID=A0AAW2HGA8_9NEOP
MSTIGVTFHTEDIHKIIKQSKPPTTTIKVPMYETKITKKRVVDSGTKTVHVNAHVKAKSGHQTFGLAHYEAPNCSNFLKKKTKTKPLPPVDKKEFVCTSNCNLPRLPKWKIECPKRSDRNFVKENIKWADSLEPKIPPPRSVDSPRGTVKDLTHLIQMIKVRESENYGKVPAYLCERKKRLQRYLDRKKKQDEIERAYREQMGIGVRGMSENVYMIDEETRAKLLQGLKEHWNELSKQFLRLPVMCDTMTKIKRKTWLENEIDRVERDVKLIEGHPCIYVERTDTKRTDEIAAEILRQQELERKAEKEREKEKKAESELVPEAGEEPKDNDQEVRNLNYEKEAEK